LKLWWLKPDWKYIDESDEEVDDEEGGMPNMNNTNFEEMMSKMNLGQNDDENLSF